MWHLNITKLTFWRQQPNAFVSAYTALYVEFNLQILWLAEIKSCSQNSGHWNNVGSIGALIEIVMSEDDTFRCQ